MDQLIVTAESAIVYGQFRGNENEELFRCPRQNIETDLKRYINEYRSLVAPMGSDKIPFVDDNTKNLREVEGKELVDYWRMYYRNGWAGRWMNERSKPTRLDCIGVNHIIDWICERFKRGCNWEMENFFIQNEFKPWGNGKRYIIKPFMSDYYKIMIDTTYGNGDYPVRIYVYKDKED